MIALRQRAQPTFTPGPALARASLANDDATRLIGLVRETCAAGIPRRVLLLRLSALPAERTPPHHLRLAHDALAPLLGADRAQLFALPSRDLAVVWRGEARTALENSLLALRHLFTGTDFTDAGVADPDGLAVVLDLPADAGILLREASPGSRPRPVAKPAAARPLDPATVAAFEAALEQASIERFIRCRAVCTADERGFALAWEQYRLSVADIFETLVPGRDPLADPWLLRRLSRTLDRRLLAFLGHDELRQSGPFAVELNVASLLGPEFLRFDSLLPARLRGQVVIGLRPADILCDLAQFQFARDFVRPLGYRLLLRCELAHLKLLPLPRTRARFAATAVVGGGRGARDVAAVARPRLSGAGRGGWRRRDRLGTPPRRGLLPGSARRTDPARLVRGFRQTPTLGAAAHAA